MELLKEHYKEFQYCISVARTVEVDALQLTQIGACLNRAQPKTFAEKSQKRLLLDMAKNKTFINWIEQYEPQLILWLKAKDIMNHFKIKDLVFIQWTGKKYHVTLQRIWSPQSNNDEP